MINPIIREDLLYYLWKTKRFDNNNLVTTSGQTVRIIDFGHQNYDAGPDFSNARIVIDDIEWVGNAEMHVYSSDWERHGHDLDIAYDNVILHIVFEDDKEVRTTTEQLIPCIELKNLINPTIKSNYAKLINNHSWIPCEKSLNTVPLHTTSFWLQRLIAERLESKSEYLKTILEQTNNNWEETTYIFLARYMGARVNVEPFEILAKNLPLSTIIKNKDNMIKIEALLFGQAGMLNANYLDDYFVQLKNEYQFLSKKYSLKNIPSVSWKFARMRPAGFPTIRIAQFAAIMYNTSHLFSAILNSESIDEIINIIKVTPNEYWNDHYRFGKVSIQREKTIGDSFIKSIIINVICPILFLYGKSIGQDKYCERAIAYLENLKSEKNAIVSKYKTLGISCKSAADSQALLQLKKQYCDKKKCLSCRIGNKIISK
ncbi:MAG: DUF2851 family protein [Saprospiraceae bacterium]